MSGTVNYQYKDRLFRFIFGEYRENALSLYNAVNGSHYTNPEELEFNTIENFLYLGMRNDVSFLFQMEMHLYEHQSSVNPNLPLRGLSYFARQFDAYVELHGLNVYGSKLVKVPTPHFVVFYNGVTNQPEKQELRLSDAFDHPDGCLELTAVVYNINAGHNRELLEACRPLEEYATLIGKIRENRATGMDLKDAVDLAVGDCIREGILSDILKKHRAEVRQMLYTEYDEEKVMNLFRQDGIEEGMEKGMEKGTVHTILNMMRNLHLSPEQCLEAAEVPTEKYGIYRKLIAERA